MKEDLNRVLFSVTPKDGVEALAAVREALAVYLNLPVLSEEHSQLLAGNDVAVMQLRANVQHLQSQLLLAKATMQLQAATITGQGQTIDAQATTIRVLETAGQNVSRTSDSEPLIGRIVSVKKVAAKGIEVDLPQLVRSLKRRFSK